jgi:dolichyl-phosphate beta-glucosyltransferase
VSEAKRSRVAVVIPCYNEASRLNATVFKDFLNRTDSVHLVFVDDGSSDDTAEVLNGIHASCESFSSVLVLPENVGKAEAVRRGMLRALLIPGIQIVGFWDADLATPLDIIGRLAGIFEQRPHIEMAFGSRVKLLGRDIVRKPVRHYLGRVFATLASLVLRLPVYDTQCGAKLFRVSGLTEPAFSRPFLSRWIFDVEIIARYQQLYQGREEQLQDAMYEYPLEMWQDVSGSKVHSGDFLVAFSDLIRIMWRYRSRSFLVGQKLAPSRRGL